MHFGIRFDPWLFRGGFFLTGVATLAVIAGVTHQARRARPAARQPRLQLGRHAQLRPVPLPLADLPDHPRRSRPAADHLSSSCWRWCITMPITEASYRFVETADPPGAPRRDPAATGAARTAADVQQPASARRRGDGSSVALVGFAGVSIAMAPNRCVGQVECDLAAASAQTDPAAAPDTPPTATTTPVATPDGHDGDSSDHRRRRHRRRPPPSTTLPVDQRPPMAIGESVMLGAKPQLEAKGFVVDAAESRQGKDLVNGARPTPRRRPIWATPS